MRHGDVVALLLESNHYGGDSVSTLIRLEFDQFGIQPFWNLAILQLDCSH